MSAQERKILSFKTVFNFFVRSDTDSHTRSGSKTDNWIDISSGIFCLFRCLPISFFVFFYSLFIILYCQFVPLCHRRRKEYSFLEHYENSLLMDSFFFLHRMILSLLLFGFLSVSLLHSLTSSPLMGNHRKWMERKNCYISSSKSLKS